MSFAASSRPDLAGTAPSLLRQAPDVVATTQGESTILLDVRRGRYHMLNAVGGRVWALLAYGTTHGAIIRTLRAEYEIDPTGAEDRIGRDVEAMLEQLRSAGLLRIGT